MKLFFTSLLIVALIGVRAFENTLFYDPFIAHFKGKDYFSTLPDFQLSKLLLAVAFRYLINMVLSLFILKIWFSTMQAYKFWVFFYVSSGLVLLVVFVVLLNKLPHFYEAFFYVRRFLIQPLWLLVLFPAMAYEKLLRQKK